ncbi:MAG: DUF599 domain-containing protein [Burkholderiaceae bacterium]|nr:DUF599 domain-containing protein [Rhodoferax sp.]MCB2004300.1 DUF599 domain-containing protein [Rhodoferax sp.]MCB2028554.1 DUF599 domain-containing protein [Rhodoferax sp.]MCB2039330.1 DUF599 domain-containing protein [Rhodoferax sp.]MCP5259726.1 DUF599 domain-containing protein [Rhodoferax sp.]
MTASHDWLAFGIGSALFLCYEVWVLWVGWRHPDRIARSAHAFMRASWVDALSRQPGFEIVAVQALRNSLMSATISASTSALALMGTVSLAGSTIESAAFAGTPPLRIVLEMLLMATLFASFVCSAMSMRYFSHAGFVMSMPMAAPERASLNPMAKEYVKRAGLLYSWALRFFLIIAPLVVGIVRPLAMPAMTVALIVALWFFDRPARLALAVQAPPG